MATTTAVLRVERWAEKMASRTAAHSVAWTAAKLVHSLAVPRAASLVALMAALLAHQKAALTVDLWALQTVAYSAVLSVLKMAGSKEPQKAGRSAWKSVAYLAVPTADCSAVGLAEQRADLSGQK